ncbi:MAG: 50S ribosomal protein L10 [Anaerolineales bacterium]|nr:50S ribosomal protein L10 [Anaerolineales bacterium]
MAIKREKKNELLDLYKEQISTSSAFFMVSYSGITVKHLETLRHTIRELGGTLYVVKNTLAAIALKDSGIELPASYLLGTTMIGFAYDDIPGVAKALSGIANELDSITIKGGYFEGQVYSPQQVRMLADLPPLPVLQAQFLGLLQTPATRIAGALAGSIRQVVNVFNAYSEKEAAAA